MEFTESAAAGLVQSTLQGSSPYVLSIDSELEGLLQTLDDIQALASAVSSAETKGTPAPVQLRLCTVGWRNKDRSSSWTVQKYSF